MALQDKKYLVVGLGVSGMSVVRYLARHNCNFAVAESNAERFKSEVAREPLLKDITCHSDELSEELLLSFDCVVVSPGVSVRNDLFGSAKSSGVEIIGDVELFARENSRPVLAVTGSNGKSTVVSMAGALLQAGGINACVIGNVGFPCLDSLNDESIEAYVLELSSFQLETTHSLQPLAATVLNVCEDHLDRYKDIEDYAAVKREIYSNAKHVLFNAADKLTQPLSANDSQVSQSFSDTHPGDGRGADWEIRDGVLIGPNDIKLDASSIKVAGAHNQINALVAVALSATLLTGDSLKAAYNNGLGAFSGLPHRTELVCEADSVSWINDSKGTNVGAAVSAITGMSAPVILIAGGRGKNADYQPLRDAVSGRCTAVILIGEEAANIDRALGDVVPVFHEATMHDAVVRAADVSTPGDCVLLSPACASFDMFNNFEERGEVFETEVKKLCA